MSAAKPSAAPFAVRTIAILVVVAVLGFCSYLVLSAYAPDFKVERNGAGHALSTSAVGFAGVVDLVKDTQGNVGLVRKDADLMREGLVVLTPAINTDSAEVKSIIDRREGEGLATLVVLPKWNVVPLPGKPAWVKARSVLPSFFVTMPLDGITPIQASEIAPNGSTLRTVSGKDLVPVFESPGGGLLVAGIGSNRTYVLADPDVLDNKGVASEQGARRALQVLAELTPEDEGVAFDLTLAGFGRNPNLLKLAFEPPFLPLTLCILFATLLAGWHALRRFGPPAHEERKVAFGKAAIAENGAALLRLAKRRHRTGERYVMLTRDAVAQATGAPVGLQGADLDRYLDRLTREGEPFTSIAARAIEAPDTRKLLAAVRDLYLWKRTVTRDNR
jgi:hypothetical protein